jgi:adenylate cyclase class 1
LYSNIKEIKLRLSAINQLRVNRALSVMKPVYQQVYLLLPVFLHYQHPLFPGYIANEDVPHGIWDFQSNELQRYYIDELFSHHGQSVELPTEIKPVITGVYSMGSTASIGQNIDSDLDIWVCYPPGLKKNQLHNLQKKCLLLEQWAQSLGVEISLFLINENRFRANQSGCLDDEDCGSTQHILLLDEFYRSSVQLAGKAILWSVIPIEQENNYDNYAKMLFDNGTLSAADWLDLGGLGSLSAEEYFGASLWQLYKSIDSPYKAVLKTLLLEAYSWEYPNTNLLALNIKKRLQEGEFLNVNIDSYCMMLERVTEYLTAIGDFTRLDLVRRCFYLKVSEHLSNTLKPINWRHEILNQLVVDWGWEQERLAYLDNRSNWKIEDVRKAHDELLDAMMQSYRNLIRFARKNNLSVSASPQDIGVLTRKLYAAFEALPGKITLVNPLISPDLSEKHLTLVRVAPNSANRSGWYLYNHSPRFDDIIGHQPLEYHPYVNKLLAWSYFNGLLTSQTKLHIRSQNPKDVIKINRLCHDMAEHFAIRVEAATPKELYSPCEIRQLTIIINLENDPTEEFKTSEINFDFRNLDVLSFGQQQQCLIGSIDLLYRNSWNEVRTLHFSGEQSVLEALKTIVGKMHQDAEPPRSINVFCYSQHLDELIASQVRQLVQQSIEFRLSSTRNEQGRFKAIKIAGQTWGLFFERLSVSAQKLENAIEFYGAISNNKLNDVSIPSGSQQIDLPAVIDGVASEGIVQFFFEDGENEFTIYILDELNRVDVYSHCDGSKEEFIRDISRFYASAHDRFTYDPQFVNFNLPQFYQIVVVEGVKQVVPFTFNGGIYHSNSSYPTIKEVSEVI